jgi:hypothetical protein
VLHVPRLSPRPAADAPGLDLDAFGRLLEALDEAGAETPAPTAWMAGTLEVESLETPVVLSTSEVRPRRLATWARSLTRYGFGSILCCQPSVFGEEGSLSPSALSVLTGHGIVLASRGLRGEPLIDADVGVLRRELNESREQLGRLARYPIRLLAPEPTATDRAFDGLIRREAARAGYALGFAPGRRVTPSFDDSEFPVLEHLTCYTSDDPEELARWVAGSSTDRRWTQLKRLADTPRRLWSRVVERRGD